MKKFLGHYLTDSLRRGLSAKSLAILLMLCLPLQATLAVAMPFLGPSGADMGAHATAPGQNPHCDSTAKAGSTEEGQLPADEAPFAPGDFCDSCALCHLASSGLPPLGSKLAPTIAVGDEYGLLPSERYVSHIPEQPQRPPSAA